MAKNICNTVRDAARYLDQHFPKWINKVSVDTLDMGSYYTCVLGQVIGGVDEASQYVRSHWDISAMEARAFYRYDDEWKALINERLGKAPAPSDIVVAVDSVTVTIGGVSVNLTQDKLKALIAQLQKFVV